MRIFMTCILLSIMSATFAQNNIIPKPVFYKEGKGNFNAGISTLVTAQDPNLISSNIIKSLIDDLFPKQSPKTARGIQTVNLALSKDNDLGKEGYALSVKPRSIDIKATTPIGIFYALQSLLQQKGTNNGFIPSCEIKDYPRFTWRGLMLDVSRHFFTKQEVKDYIHLMSAYKFNVLHFHLSDDNGWRLEIKSLPRLTEVGAWRVQRYGRFGDRDDPKPGEPATYGGFYTQQDMKEIIAYANAHNVTIVPEIDMPGHSMAALAAYPELSASKKQVQVNPGTHFAEWFSNGTFKMNIDNTLNPSDEKVYEFIDKVMTEIAALFPSPYIHAGGDECYHGYWEQDPACNAFMKKNNLKDVKELQSYFVKRVAAILASKGKQLIGWNEIMEGGLAPGAAVMSWQGMKWGIEASNKGHYVVMSPTDHCYLDYMQGDRKVEVPIYASLTLKKSYEFDPMPAGANEKYILGGQANLWTEQIPTYRHALYMTYPRAFATSEAVWSQPISKDWANFFTRTEKHFIYFDNRGLAISRSAYNALATTFVKDSLLYCTLDCEAPNVSIHYTIDNTFPDAQAAIYTTSVNIPPGDVNIRFVTYRGKQALGPVITLSRAELLARVKK